MENSGAHSLCLSPAHLLWQSPFSPFLCTSILEHSSEDPPYSWAPVHDGCLSSSRGYSRFLATHWF